jgi:hypothetical protein
MFLGYVASVIALEMYTLCCLGGIEGVLRTDKMKILWGPYQIISPGWLHGAILAAVLPGKQNQRNFPRL